VSIFVIIYSLFLTECACTTIIDISPRIFSLMYCCCVSIVFVICICPPGALIWLINLFLFSFYYLDIFFKFFCCWLQLHDNEKINIYSGFFCEIFLSTDLYRFLLWNCWTKLEQIWLGWSLCPTAPPSIQNGCCY
jgi:hypothetical protein